MLIFGLPLLHKYVTKYQKDTHSSECYQQSLREFVKVILNKPKRRKKTKEHYSKFQISVSQGNKQKYW